ncbi:hypothetical protein K470DRAFT_256076 [Piedraia hortae CBS 480.64]|uniref:Uncharacterized protein n=1 Tax=Piedraia hortae CBS 480.64 TaxID=1314780 RepID=A0A6A7C4Y6_9PEZI|nr:hypothetical protein K470DRAFT_256076 [Piedraia hortae CBS 480.64]
MAETAPLTMASTHARQAAKETLSGNWVRVAEEHELAAADFASAAKATADPEARRLLKSLETEHQRLVTTIRNQRHTESSGKPYVVSSTPVKTGGASNKSPRESSPTLARDIAFRRGIGRPPSKLQYIGSPQSRPQHISNLTREVSSPNSRSDQPRALTRPAGNEAADEGFSRFYQNITSGVGARVSAALAYAGLPLAEDEDATEAPAGKTVKAGPDADLSRHFSPNILHALEGERSRARAAAAESFYVVPPPGSKTGPSEEMFMDARETPSKYRQMFGARPTTEEVELENATLKHTIDTLASRLQQFELHAQEATMAAITQSVVSLRGDESAVVQQLQRQLEHQKHQMQKLEEHAQKQEKQLKKWAANYEKLKANAKKRLDAKAAEG